MSQRQNAFISQRSNMTDAWSIAGNFVYLPWNHRVCGHVFELSLDNFSLWMRWPLEWWSLLWLVPLSFEHYSNWSCRVHVDYLLAIQSMIDPNPNRLYAGNLVYFSFGVKSFGFVTPRIFCWHKFPPHSVPIIWTKHREEWHEESLQSPEVFFIGLWFLGLLN